MLEEEYEEQLDKELKRRKMHVFRDVGIVVLSVVFALYLFLFQERSNMNMVLMLVLVGYGMITIYGLRKKMILYYIYFDELQMEKGSIVKYNPKQDKIIIKIPFDSITGVYTNIKKMPYTLYVLYEDEGKKKGQRFYKTRIQNEDEFEKLLYKKNLIKEEYVDVEDLMDIIEGVSDR